jgi:hypothetical protein
MYKFEWDQRSQLISAVNIPILGLTALATLLGTTLISFPYESELKWPFLGACFITGLILFAALYFVLRSMLDITYKKMPDPSKLRAHYKLLEDWHKNAKSPDGTAERDFQDNFDEKLAEAAAANSKINKKRGDCIYFAIRLISISILPCSLAGGMHVFANATQPEKKYHVVLDGNTGAPKHDQSISAQQQSALARGTKPTTASAGASQAAIPSTGGRTAH